MYTTGDPNLDKAVIEAGKSVLSGIFKSLWTKTVDNVPSWFKRKYQQEDPFGQEAQQYTESVERRYNMMKIIGMSGPVPIRNIFVRVNILEKITAQQRLTADEMESFFDRDKKGFGAIQKTETGFDVANREDRLIILGKPGGGKTTFMKWLALSALDDKFQKKRVPVFLSLKDWNDSTGTLIDAIYSEFKICALEEPHIFVNELLVEGKIMLLLDGYDEVSDRAAEAIKEITEISAKYPKIKMIMSCRNAAYNYVFQQFRDVELADFNKMQIDGFINNWFIDNTQKASMCIKSLEVEQNRSIANLCATPLLLTLMCIAFDENMSFPPNRAELYKEALDALLKKWDTSRAIKRNTEYKQLSLSKKELLLSELAAKSFAEGKYFIRQDELELGIKKFMDNLKPENGNLMECDATAVLKEIESQHGILVERANRIFSFSHLTFQEFFTAKHITSNTNQLGPSNLINEHSFDPRWREVFILTTGLLTKADDFVMKIRERLSLLSAEFNLSITLRNIASLITAAAGLPLPLRRALAVKFVMEQVQQVHPEFAAVTNAVDELLEDMQKEFGKISNIDRETLTALQMGLHKNRKNAEEIISAIANSSYVDSEKIQEYILLTRLLVNCLNVDAYISAPVRAKIVDSIFLEKIHYL